MQSSNIKYLPQVDQLRAVAAIWIILYHSTQLIGSVMLNGVWFSPQPWPITTSPLTSLVVEGHSAVALFMVLSGFIFTCGAYGKEIKYSSFIYNRFVRIYPLYLVVLLLSISASAAQFSISDLASVILPLADVGGLKGNAIAGMSWAVAVEFQFYLIFPFILASLNKSPAKTVIGIICVAVLLRVVAYGNGASPRELSYWHLAGRIDQFMLGMAAAVALKKLAHHRAALVAVLAFSSVAIVSMLFLLNINGGWYSDSVWKLFYPTVEGFVYCLFILGFVGTKNIFPDMFSRMICKLGECSFSIYLLHFPIVTMIAKKPALQIHFFESPFANLLGTIAFVVIPLTLALAFLTYHVVELPFLSKRKRYLSS
ncbi:acyltransferase family protein [Pseudomonas sp. PSKL.D1]|uniref:acyltransferase family protein n=1 Tax=Pseudomonas sp. PSKL.D1 TaxID=3029060 RepID=UPI0023815EFA|nr:acyltransferase [Pseudomonas sp. PSKL.D1]WDY59858.1 acyltransferase [Pseudomonas sp. PSKL.D1]